MRTKRVLQMVDARHYGIVVLHHVPDRQHTNLKSLRLELFRYFEIWRNEWNFRLRLQRGGPKHPCSATRQGPDYCTNASYNYSTYLLLLRRLTLVYRVPYGHYALRFLLAGRLRLHL